MALKPIVKERDFIKCPLGPSKPIFWGFITTNMLVVNGSWGYG
jgi:hypothetical protein